MATTSWTDSEYALVAEALLYPGSRLAIVVNGYTPVAGLAWQLDGRLQQLDATGKARALLLAQEVQNGEDSLSRMASGGGCGAGAGDLAVTRVSDITLDNRQGLTLQQGLISRTRSRLSSFVDFPVNPNSDLASGGGGTVNGSWRR